jgi:hypothetical protein
VLLTDFGSWGDAIPRLERIWTCMAGASNDLSSLTTAQGNPRGTRGRKTEGATTRAESLAAVSASTSWRLTAPLSGAASASRWFVGGLWIWLTFRPGSRPHRVARRGAIAVARFFLDRPRLTRPARTLLWRFPAIRNRLRMMRLRLMLSPSDASPAHFQSFAQDNENSLSALSPRARSVYVELKLAIAMYSRSR